MSVDVSLTVQDGPIIIGEGNIIEERVYITNTCVWYAVLLACSGNPPENGQPERDSAAARMAR